MKADKKQILLLLLALIFCISARIKAQLDPNKQLHQYTYDSWTVRNGLPTSTLIKIHQSKNGYLWLTSYQGLVRFDGFTFKIFDKNNVDVLKNSSIVCFHEDTKGTIWLGTEGSGLVSYKDGIFKSYQSEHLDLFIRSILVDEEKEQIWLGTTNQGLYLFDYKTFRQVNYEPVNDITVIDIKKDQKGTIWIATEGKGISSFKDFKWHNYTSDDGLNNDNINRLYIDSENTLWISSLDGLTYFDEKDFHIIEKLNKIEVKCVLKDENDNLYIASHKGLGRILSQSKNIEWLQNKPDLPNHEIDDLIFDTEGSLWLMTYRRGIVKIKNSKFTNITSLDGLSSKAVSSILEYDKNQYIIGGNYGSINQVNNNQVSEFKINKQLVKDRVYSLNKDIHNNIWVCTNGGLLRVKPNGKETLFNKKNGLPSDKYMVSYTDKNGVLWAGTRTEGLLKIVNPNTEGTLKYTLYNKSNGMSSNFIMSIEENSEGNIIAGTNTGGVIIISKNDSISIYSKTKGLLSNLVFNTHTDKEGITWVVSNAGLSRINNGKIFNYTNKDGIPSDSPFDFLEDDYGYCWMPSSIGIIRVKKQELNEYIKDTNKQIEWKVFDTSDGMKQNECNGATQSLIATDGKLWIPTFDGVAIIDPHDIHLNTKKPPVFIESLIIDGNEIEANDKTEIKSETQRIQFNFTALSLKTSHKNKFKYKLENFDHDWIYAGTARKAVYTNLQADDYTFKVIACNDDGVWNLKGDNLRFTVLPSWWLTWWAKTIGLFIILGSAYSIYIIRVKTLKSQKAFLELEVAKRTYEIIQQKKEIENQAKELKSSNDKLIALDQFKESMTGMLIHDLKNPLNTIINFSNSIPNKIRTKKIHEAGNLILNMTYNLLDVQKFEEAKASLNKDEFPISTLVKLSIEQTSYLIEEKNITIINDVNEGVYGYFDCDLILRVIVNLLTNAIKYTPLNGEIQARLKKDDENIVLSITDNGKGIPKDKLDIIFNKYAQLDNNRSGQIRSSGIGLTFCKLVIEAHGGKIGVKSEPDKGACFWFSVQRCEAPLGIIEKKLKQKTKKQIIAPILLNENEKTQLKPQLDKLKNWEVFDFSEVNEILNEIDSDKNPSVKSWLEEMQNAVQNMNEEKYKALISIED